MFVSCQRRLLKKRKKKKSKLTQSTAYGREKKEGTPSCAHQKRGILSLPPNEGGGGGRKTFPARRCARKKKRRSAIWISGGIKKKGTTDRIGQDNLRKEREDHLYSHRLLFNTKEGNREGRAPHQKRFEISSPPHGKKETKKVINVVELDLMKEKRKGKGKESPRSPSSWRL